MSTYVISASTRVSKRTIVAVPGRVGEVRVQVPADEPEAVDLDPDVLARRLDLTHGFSSEMYSTPPRGKRGS